MNTKKADRKYCIRDFFNNQIIQSRVFKESHISSFSVSLCSQTPLTHFNLVFLSRPALSMKSEITSNSEITAV